MTNKALNLPWQVEITCRGQSIIPTMALHNLIDLWLRSGSSLKVPAFLGTSAKEFVMVLSYRRRVQSLWLRIRTCIPTNARYHITIVLLCNLLLFLCVSLFFSFLFRYKASVTHFFNRFSRRGFVFPVINVFLFVNFTIYFSFLQDDQEVMYF